MLPLRSIGFILLFWHLFVSCVLRRSRTHTCTVLAFHEYNIGSLIGIETMFELQARGVGTLCVWYNFILFADIVFLVFFVGFTLASLQYYGIVLLNADCDFGPHSYKFIISIADYCPPTASFKP